MAHDVFISYSTQDKPIADAVCAGLESRGIRCWIAPRDILAGVEWGQAIVDAISSARVMVLLLSKNANASTQIPKEVDRAMNKGVTVIPLRIQDVQPTGSLEFHLSAAHWLDAITPPLESHIERLAGNVSALLQRSRPRNIPDASVGSTASGAASAAAGPSAANQARPPAPPPPPPRRPQPPEVPHPQQFAGQQPPAPPALNYAHPPQHPASSGAAIAFYILSLFVPIAGIILWVVYKDRPFPQDRSMAMICLVIGIVSFVMSCVVFAMCGALGNASQF